MVEGGAKSWNNQQFLKQKKGNFLKDVLVDKALGVFIGDGRPESVAAVKAALQGKLDEKAELIDRLWLLDDPQVQLQLLRSCASTRPGFWMRTMSPSLTRDAAASYDAKLRRCFAHVCRKATVDDATWTLATLPLAMGGKGVVSSVATASAAHYASWAASWENVVKMCPALGARAAGFTRDSPIARLPFVAGILDAYDGLKADLYYLTPELPNLHLPFTAPAMDALPTPTDLSTRLPRAQSASAALAHCARWVKDFLARDAPARAVRMSASFPGAQAAFAAVPAHKWRMEPANFLVAMERSLRLPLTCLTEVVGCRCACGRDVDAFGDHFLSCSHFLTFRKVPHDLIQEEFRFMGRSVGMTVARDDTRPR